MENEIVSEALQLIREQTDKGNSFQQVAELTGFNAKKLYQWDKQGKFPSIKVAKKIYSTLRS